MKRILKIVAGVFLAAWLGFTAYNIIALRLPVRDSLISPALQIPWTVIALIGMVMYQWPARIVALVIIAALSAIVIYRRRRN